MFGETENVPGADKGGGHWPPMSLATRSRISDHRVVGVFGCRVALASYPVFWPWKTLLPWGLCAFSPQLWVKVSLIVGVSHPSRAAGHFHFGRSLQTLLEGYIS